MPHFFFLLIIPVAFSQIPPNLGLTFNAKESAKLDKAKESLEQAGQDIKKSVSAFNNIPQDTSVTKAEKIQMEEEALAQLKLASKAYQAANNEIYTTYKEAIDNFWNKIGKEGQTAIGIVRSRYYEDLAKRAHQEALAKRDLLQEASQFDLALRRLNAANQLEADANLYHGRALRIYQDFPVEYDYQWENDPTVNEILAMKKKEKEELNEKMFGKHKVEQTEQKQAKDTLTQEQEKVEATPVPQEPIEFRVQIAAHTIRLDEAYIKSIYKGDKQVEEIIEDDWYKYQIGSYTSFGEAEKVLVEADVERAFVVAYQAGNKINVRDAKEIAP
ncbi:MAG: hypothetical protein HC896_09525 [Bacteroidales bacterium]|nr:hypothetical protein [Bacteroidales bacterium]